MRTSSRTPRSSGPRPRSSRSGSASAPASSRLRWRSQTSLLPPARLQTSRVVAGHLPGRRPRARPPRARRLLPRRRARLPRSVRASARRGGLPARRGRGGGRAGLGDRRRGRGGAVRGRDQRGRRGRSRGRSAALRGRGDGRPSGHGPRARGRRDLAQCPHPGRRDRPGPRGPAARARAHPAPLPAVVSVLDPRRMDRHPRRRALLDRRDPHRRPRRVGPRGHPGRACGSRAGCRARAPGSPPTGCCSAQRGSSGSSPRRGSASARGPGTGPRPGCASPTSPPARAPSAPWPSRVFTPRPAGSWTRPRPR